MSQSAMLSRQGRCLLQLGVALFLFTSFEGFVIPALAVPNLGRSVHTLAAFSGILFLVMGLMWPMLELGTTAARIAFWFLVYSALATIAAFVVAALWGAGASIIPIAAQGARGSDFQETVIQACPNRHHCLCADTLGASRQVQFNKYPLGDHHHLWSHA
jgi:(hydroxyamino)benzene mutase